MQFPVQITFKGIDHSDFIEARILERAEKLERFAGQIMSCRVVVERATHRHHKGDIYHVHINATMPGRELVVSRDPERGDAHADVYVAVRDAFDALRRQLEDAVRRKRGEEKFHAVPPHGRVSSIDVTAGRGIILTSDDRELVFSRNSVVDGDFERLQPGDEVRFTESTGQEGPAASTVRVIGKHHVIG